MGRVAGPIGMMNVTDRKTAGQSLDGVRSVPYSEQMNTPSAPRLAPSPRLPRRSAKSTSAPGSRRLRLAHGLSQRALAKRAGVSNATVSMIEANRVSPSVAALKQILAGFPLGLASFFAVEDAETEKVVWRAEEFTEIAGGAISYRQVGGDLAGRSLQMLHERYRPGSDSGRVPISHQGEEAGLVIRGPSGIGSRRHAVDPACRRRLFLRQPKASRFPQHRRYRSGHRLGVYAAELLTGISGSNDRGSTANRHGARSTTVTADPIGGAATGGR